MAILLKIGTVLLSLALLADAGPSPNPSNVSPLALGAISALSNSEFQANPPLDSVSYLQAKPMKTYVSQVNGITVRVNLGKSKSAVVTNGNQRLEAQFSFPSSGAYIWKSSKTPGVLALLADGHTVLVPLPRTDGSLSISNVLLDPRAGNRIRLLDSANNLCLPVNSAKPKKVRARTLCFYIAPAWAMDSNGTNVPSTYEFSSRGVYQRINTNGIKPRYPIVTQALLGVSFVYKETWIANHPVGPTLEVFPTGFGRIMGLLSTYPTTNTAKATLDFLGSTAAWLEVVQKGQPRQKALARSASMRIQFLCHYFFVSKVRQDKASWNLDLARPKTDLATAVRFRCNPPQ
jgi:Protein of unknown function (DUF2599)